MEGRQPQRHLAREIRIVREDRTDQRSLAPPGQRDGVIGPVIGHHRADRAEGLDIMDRLRRIGGVAIHQHRIQKGPAFGIARHQPHIAGIARHDGRIGGQVADAVADLNPLRLAGQRAHAHDLVAGVADRGFRQPRGQRRDHGILAPARHENAADGGAFLARLDGHFARNLAHEQIEFGAVRVGIGAKHGGVQAVGFHRESHAFFDHRRVGFQLAPGRGRAGEGDHILTGHMVQQIADAAGNQAYRAGRQMRLHVAHHQFGQIGRLAARLDDRGHPRDQRRRQLFQHAPAGKVEGVDMDRGAFQRCQDMLAQKAAIA